MQLASTEEYIDGQFTGNLGEVLIRFEQLLYIVLAVQRVHSFRPTVQNYMVKY